MKSVLVILCLLLSAMAMQPAASAGIPYRSLIKPTQPKGGPPATVKPPAPSTVKPPSTIHPGRGCCNERCCGRGCC